MCVCAQPVIVVDGKAVAAEINQLQTRNTTGAPPLSHALYPGTQYSESIRKQGLHCAAITRGLAQCA
jgi:hypothetical protein